MHFFRITVAKYLLGRFNRYFMLSTLCISLFATVSFVHEAKAQYYPTFTDNIRIGNIVLPGGPYLGSPAITTFNNLMFVAYVDASNGNTLTVASAVDGVKYTTHPLSISTDSDSALTVYNGLLYMAYTKSGAVHVLNSRDGYNFTDVGVVYYSGVASYGMRPAIAALNDVLYLAWSGTAYDTSNGRAIQF